MTYTTWELLRYAVEERNYLAVVGILLQQRWLQTTFNQAAKVSGYVIIVLGITLIIFVTVVLARDAIPAFAPPGTLLYKFLMFLVVTVSYNILHNYICAAVFGLWLGRGPALGDNVPHPQQQQQQQRRRGPRYDEGSESSPSSLDSDAEFDEPLVPRASQGNGTDEVGGQLPLLSSTFVPAGTTTTRRSGRGTPVSAGRTAAPGPSLSTQQQQQQQQQLQPPGRRRAAFRGTNSAVDSTRLALHYFNRVKRLVARFLLVVYECVDAVVNARAHAATRAVIDPNVLEEIEAITVELENYTATERRYKLLDPARRFCRHCNRTKAPREHHCSVCQRCVPRMHHHCPFISNCVDVENVRYFVLLLFWLWVGTFCADVFIGYGSLRQWWYERRVGQARTIAERAALVAPYGANGGKLTGFPVTLTLTLTVIMFAVMTVFVFVTGKETVENITPVERVVVEDKQERVFRSTSFVFRTPYHLGAWRNVLECFRTLDDPLVHADLRRGNGSDDGLAAEGDKNSSRNRQIATDLSSLLPPARSFAEAQARRTAWRALILWWLMALPTLRPTGTDGVHYPIYDTETRNLDGHCIAGCRAKHGADPATAILAVQVEETDPEGKQMESRDRHHALRNEREGSAVRVPRSTSSSHDHTHCHVEETEEEDALGATKEVVWL